MIFFLGTEPNLNWKEFSEAILGVAEQFAVVRIYLLGGVLDKTPHTKEPSVSCTCSSRELKEEIRKYGMQSTSYEGPGSFGTTLLHVCQNRPMPMVIIHARATYYPEFNIVIPHNPKATRAVVRRLNSLLYLDLDLADLDGQAEEFEAKLGFMASHNPEFRAYVEELERDFIEAVYEEPLDISANEGVRIAEEFLKGKKEEQ